jgi:hypothetical protein
MDEIRKRSKGIRCKINSNEKGRLGSTDSEGGEEF